MANPNPPAPPDNTGKTYNTKKNPNPKTLMFKQFYADPTSYTFWNVRGSAIRAGYSESYADNITVQNPKWWREYKESAEYTRAQMLHAAENNIKRTLITPAEDKDDKKIQHDASKFVSERLGKDHYSTRKELTDKGGKRLFSKDHKDTSKVALEDLFVVDHA